MIIIEKGHNTSGIYSLFTALFRNNIEGINRLFRHINKNEPEVMYLQEYINQEIKERLIQNKSLNKTSIYRVKHILNYIKFYDEEIDILDEVSPIKLYNYLADKIFNSHIEVEYYKKNNSIETNNFSSIVLDLDDNTIINDISTLANEKMNIGIYKFSKLSYVIPIVLNRKADNIMVDIKYAISFNTCNDDIQKDFIWHIMAIILKINDKYCTVVKSAKNDKWYMIDENTFPSEKKINMYDKNIVNLISTNAIMIFYSI